jgi:hypothetical protein
MSCTIRTKDWSIFDLLVGIDEVTERHIAGVLLAIKMAMFVLSMVTFVVTRADCVQRLSMLWSDWLRVRAAC